MKLQGLREQVCAANRMLPQAGLVVLTQGNVSGFDPKTGLMVIKPSGIPYEQLTPEKMVLVDRSGYVVEGALRPSSDTNTHLLLYQQFPTMRSIVHTHSRWATIWAQCGRNIPPFGTTHADDFGEEILCTRAMDQEEIQGDYERNTGKVIAETLMGKDMSRHFGVLVREHGPFVWEVSPEKAVEKAMILEDIAMMAWHCCVLDPGISTMSKDLLRKHFERKHGDSAYYGQQHKESIYALIGK